MLDIIDSSVSAAALNVQIFFFFAQQVLYSVKRVIFVFVLSVPLSYREGERGNKVFLDAQEAAYMEGIYS